MGCSGRLSALLAMLCVPHASVGLLVSSRPLCSTVSRTSSLNRDLLVGRVRTTNGQQTSEAVHNAILRGISTRQQVMQNGTGTATLPPPAPPRPPPLSAQRAAERAAELAANHGPFVLSENVLKMHAAELYEYAKRLVQTRQYREAEAAFERLLSISDDDGKAWMQLVRIYKQTRSYKKAEATLRRSIEACPDNAKLRQALADLCRQQKRYDEAREHFRRAMLIDPQMQSIYDSWGRMESGLGRHAVGASLIARGIAIQPTARLYHALAVAQDTRGRTEDARAACLAGLQLPGQSTNPQLLHALGMVEVRAGDARRARKCFLLAVESKADFTMAHLALGRLEEQLGNFEAARRRYGEGATTPQPASGALPAARRGAVQLWQSWARMEQRLNRPQAALRLYERASRWYASDQQLVVEWAKLLTDEGELHDARAKFDALLRAARPRPYTFQCYAALEAADGNADAARALYEAGARLTPSDALAKAELVPLLHAWAVFEWKGGGRTAARKLFERAEALGPCGWLYQWHARLEADGGNVVLARHYYARAVNAAPRDSSAWRLWADLEESLNQTERAAALLRRSVELEAEDWLRLDGGGSPLKRGRTRGTGRP